MSSHEDSRLRVPSLLHTNIPNVIPSSYSPTDTVSPLSSSTRTLTSDNSPTDSILSQALSFTSTIHNEDQLQIGFDSNATLYAKIPLSQDSKTSIRVIDLETSRGPDDIRIIGYLRPVDLVDKPIFSALSYVWGNEPTPKRTITCNDYDFQVTENCFDALYHLQKQFGSITVWVDSICINQKNEMEKNLQIPLMREIFSLASPVYVWLGNGDLHTDKAMAFLSKGGLKTWNPIKFEMNDSRYKTRSMNLRTGAYVFWQTITFQYSPHFRGLEDIFSRPWIDRLWPMQELALSRNAIILCGNKSTSWASFIHALTYMDVFGQKCSSQSFPKSRERWLRQYDIWTYVKRRSPEPNIESLPGVSDSVSTPLYKRFLFKSLKIYTHQQLALLTLTFASLAVVFVLNAVKGHLTSWTLLLLVFGIWGLLPAIRDWNTSRPPVIQLLVQDAILTELSQRSSSSDKDKYFAVLGIIRPKTGTTLSVVDSNSLAEIYRALTIDLIYWMGSLDILLVESDSGILGSPSWVIDWRRAKLSWIHSQYLLLPLVSQSMESRAEGESILQSFWYTLKFLWSTFGSPPLVQYIKSPSTTHGSPSIFKFDLDGNLVVRGICISRLWYCSSSLKRICRTSCPCEELQSVTELQNAFCYEESGNLRKLRDYVRHAGGLPWTQESQSSVDAWSKVMLEGKQKGSEWTLKRLKRHRELWKIHVNLFNRTAEDDHRLVRCFGNLGSFGFAPKNVSIGDLVILISGAAMPIILRETHRHSYKVIGPAFIAKAMQGEIWRNVDANSLETFVLS